MSSMTHTNDTGNTDPPNARGGDRGGKPQISPAICRSCGKRFDLADATVIARHSDATVFTKPCCGGIADDRRWVVQSYRRVLDHPYVSPTGELAWSAHE